MNRKILLHHILLILGVVILFAACTAVSTPTNPPASTDLGSDVKILITPMPAMPTSTPTTTAPQTFAVLADRGWDSVGMYIRQGQQFEITARGSWSNGLGENPSGPGGTDRFEPDSVLPSAPIGALIGRIGDNPPFEIGEHAIMMAEFGGEFRLSINDRLEALSDNTGTLEVAVALGPDPAIPTNLLTNEIDGYRLVFPVRYQAVIYENGMCLTLSEAWMMACHVANVYIEVSDAASRSLSQVADQVAANGNPVIPVKRTNLTISGVEAILLDDIYAYDVLRKVAIVNDDRVYILTFVPWNEDLEDFSSLENLYNTVIGSFSILPSPETPPLTPPVPDLATISIRSLSSTSSNRQWRAEALLAAFAGDSPADYARLTVSRTDGSASLIPYEELSDYGGLGSGYISEFYWSADGLYLYFTATASSEPCGYPFTTNLRRVDLTDGSLFEIPLTGMGFGEVTISAGAERMAYRTEDGIFIYDLANGSSRTLPYRWPEGFGYVVGWNAWSPDGEELAFSITEPLCDSNEPTRTTIQVINLDSGETRLPTPNDSWLYLPEMVSADPIPTAALVLQDFLNSLYWGGRGGQGDYNYEHAAALYGGSYETLIEMNPDLDLDDHPTLLRNACQLNGFQCLRLRDVISSHVVRGEGGAQVVEFTVYLMNPDGSVFVRGTCCGEGIGFPQTRFVFSVRQREDGTFTVLELPPYVP